MVFPTYNLDDFFSAFHISVERKFRSTNISRFGDYCFYAVYTLPYFPLDFQEVWGIIWVKITTLTQEVTSKAQQSQFPQNPDKSTFLFNALNTLYGSALTENCRDKTSDGTRLCDWCALCFMKIYRIKSPSNGKWNTSELHSIFNYFVSEKSESGT